MVRLPLVFWISLIRLQFLRFCSSTQAVADSLDRVFYIYKNLLNKSCISSNRYLEGIKAFIAIIKDCFSQRGEKYRVFTCRELQTDQGGILLCTLYTTRLYFTLRGLIFYYETGYLLSSHFQVRQRSLSSFVRSSYKCSLYPLLYYVIKLSIITPESAGIGAGRYAYNIRLGDGLQGSGWDCWIEEERIFFTETSSLNWTLTVFCLLASNLTLTNWYIFFNWLVNF